MFCLYTFTLRQAQGERRIECLAVHAEPVEAWTAFWRHALVPPFTNLPASNLEISEELEQLRALENGYKIKVIGTKYDTIGVDTPEDLEKVKEKLIVDS